MDDQNKSNTPNRRTLALNVKNERARQVAEQVQGYANIIIETVREP